MSSECVHLPGDLQGLQAEFFLPAGRLARAGLLSETDKGLRASRAPPPGRRPLPVARAALSFAATVLRGACEAGVLSVRGGLSMCRACPPPCAGSREQ